MISGGEPRPDPVACFDVTRLPRGLLQAPSSSSEPARECLLSVAGRVAVWTDESSHCVCTGAVLGIGSGLPPCEGPGRGTTATTNIAT